MARIPARLSASRTTRKRHGWRLSGEGASRTWRRISRRSSSGTCCPRYLRIARRDSAAARTERVEGVGTWVPRRGRKDAQTQRRKGKRSVGPDHLDLHFVVQAPRLGPHPVAAGTEREPHARHRAAVHEPPDRTGAGGAGGAEPHGGVLRGDPGNEPEDVSRGGGSDPEKRPDGIGGGPRGASLSDHRGEPGVIGER